jgi:hypothetical protein
MSAVFWKFHVIKSWQDKNMASDGSSLLQEDFLQGTAKTEYVMD